MDLDKTRSVIEKECLGKDACFIENFSRFMKNEVYLKMESNYAKCIDDNAVFYV